MTSESSVTMATPTSDLIDETGSTSAAANTVTMGISPTSAVGGLSVAMATNTDSMASVTFDSSTDLQPSTQFPMQHSTEPLPSNPVHLTTTDSMTLTSTVGQYTLNSDSSASILPSDSVSAESETVSSGMAVAMDTVSDVIPSTTSSVNEVTYSTTTSINDIIPSTTSSVDEFISSQTTSVSSDSSKTTRDTIADSSSLALPMSAPVQPSSTSSLSSTEQSTPPSSIHSESLDPNSATLPVSGTVTTNFVITTSATVSDNLPNTSSDMYINPSKSVSAPVTTSVSFYSTYVPPHTEFTGKPTTVNSVLSTSAAALPSSSPKPSEPASTSQSTLLGGGLPDLVVYIGAPGLGVLLILLLVCIICICQRNNKKNKGSSIKSHSEDLWAHSTNDLALPAISSPVQPESLENGIPMGPANAKLESGEMLLRLRKGQTGLPLKSKSKPFNDTDFHERVTSPGVAKNRTCAASNENKWQKSEEKTEKRAKNEGPEKGQVSCMSRVGRFREIRRKWEERKVSNSNELLVERRADPMVKGCVTYEAVFDFTGSHGNHLDLIEGDLIHVNRKEDGWWQGSVGERSGWFPSNYVQATSNDHLNTEDEVETGKERVTSFQLKRDDNITQRYSHMTEEQIEAEPIYCKIQHKDKRSNSSETSMRSASVTPTHPQGYNNPIYVRSDTAVNKVPSIVYTAKYAFEARNEGELTITKGDVIHCKEEGKHGWIRGTNSKTRKEGWCPASYLEKVAEKKKVIATPDPASYTHLEANKGDKPDLVGIVHQAMHPYMAEKDSDLEFEQGDHITVFQVLENGWWLGSKDNSVGWFPGAYVQMLDHPSSSPSPSTVCSESPEDEKQETAGSDGTSDVLTPPVSTTTTPTKLKPARKAPPPPLKLPLHISSYNTDKTENRASSGDKQNVSTIVAHSKPVTDEVDGNGSNEKTDDVNSDQGKSFTPEQENSILFSNKPFKIPRPKIAPPPPPSKNQPHQNSQVDHDDPLYETLGDAANNKVAVNNAQSFTDKTAATVQEVSDKPKRTKPPVPTRYIKPTFVTVPRAEVKIKEINNILANDEVVRSRAPPKISTPKLGPIRQKLSVPTNLEDQIPSTEDNTCFQLTPQRKSDLVRHESQDPPTPDSPPYRSMSSFGSTFGKPNEKLLPKPSPKPVGHVGKLETVDIDAKATAEEMKMVMGKPSSENAPSRDEKVPAVEESVAKINDSQGEIVSNDSEISKQPQKSKSGIPLTPKIKASKLQAPKQVTSTINVESANIGDSNNLVAEKTAESPVENVSKLPKLKTDNSKIPVSDLAVDKVNESERPRQNSESESPNEAVQKATPVQIEAQVPEPSVNSLIEPVEKRTRTDSFGRPPVAPKPKSNLPKCLPKPKINVKEKESSALENAKLDVRNENIDHETTTDDACNEEVQIPAVERESHMRSESRSESETDESSKSVNENESKIPSKVRTSSESESKIPSKVRSTSESESKLPVKPKVVSETESKIPLGSAIAQKSPELRGRKSHIPSPGMRTKSKEKYKTESEQEQSQASDKDGKSLRQRSNSPGNRTGIPSSVSYRSNSPAGKSGIPSPVVKSPKHKPSGLVAPKKIPNGQEHIDKAVENAEQNHVDEAPVANSNDLSNNSINAKPESPTKPARVQKQGSQDGRPPKGKSLLPLIHKSMESGKGSPNRVSPPTTGTKQKRGIPVAKAKKPSSTSLDENQSVAIQGYTAQSDGELTFTKGTSVTELSDCDRDGWFVGMLADGTTGLYPADHFIPGNMANESEA